MPGILLRFVARAKAEYGGMARRPAGLYPGVQDLTGQYGGLASATRPQTRGVILHRTETTTAASALAGYRDRIRRGSDIGAQYLIDEAGQTFLITPADAQVSHAHGWNEVTIGIEVVGGLLRLHPGHADRSLRQQLAALTLSPEFAARLLGYDDQTLAQVVSENGRGTYADLCGSQKEAVYTLCRRLARDYQLDLGSLSCSGPHESALHNYTLATLPAFSAHEHLNPKTLGEGEAMTELLRARLLYPQLVGAGAKLRERLLTQEGDAAQQALAVLDREQRTLAALELPDADERAEAADRAAPGVPEWLAMADDPPRAELCRDFYDHFYARIRELVAVLQ
jgi:hypothetical protein